MPFVVAFLFCSRRGSSTSFVRRPNEILMKVSSKIWTSSSRVSEWVFATAMLSLFFFIFSSRLLPRCRERLLPASRWSFQRVKVQISIFPEWATHCSNAQQFLVSVVWSKARAGSGTFFFSSTCCAFVFWLWTIFFWLYAAEAAERAGSESRSSTNKWAQENNGTLLTVLLVTREL